MRKKRIALAIAIVAVVGMVVVGCALRQGAPSGPTVSRNDYAPFGGHHGPEISIMGNTYTPNWTIPKPAVGDLNWADEYWSLCDKVDTGAGTKLTAAGAWRPGDQDFQGQVRAEELRAYQRTQTCCVTFVFDDVEESQWTYTKPVFDAQGEVAVIAAVTDWVGTAGYMTWTNLTTLEGLGWEIASHSKTHANLTGLTEAQIDTELSDSRDAIEAQGLTCKNLVYPYGSYNDTVKKVSRLYYRSARKASGGTNPTLLDTYALSALQVDNDGQLELFKDHVDYAYANGQWLICFAHSGSTADATMLGNLIDYIQSLSIPIVTIDGALDLIGNSLEYAERFRLGTAGKVAADRISFSGGTTPLMDAYMFTTEERVYNGTFETDTSYWTGVGTGGGTGSIARDTGITYGGSAGSLKVTHSNGSGEYCAQQAISLTTGRKHTITAYIYIETGYDPSDYIHLRMTGFTNNISAPANPATEGSWQTITIQDWDPGADYSGYIELAVCDATGGGGAHAYFDAVSHARPVLADMGVANTITLNNLTQISTRNISDINATWGSGVKLTTNTVALAADELGSINWGDEAFSPPFEWEWRLVGTNPKLAFGDGYSVFTQGYLGVGATAAGGVAGDFRLFDGDAGDTPEYAKWTVPNLSASYTLTMPTTLGSGGYLYTTSGGTMSVQTPGGSGDITGVGDVTDGDAFVTGSGKGTKLYFYDADGEGLLQSGNLTAARTWTLGDCSINLIDTSEDYVLTYNASTKTWGPEAAGAGSPTAYDDIGDPDAATDITFDDGENILYQTAVDGENMFRILQTAASLSAPTYLLELSYNADANTYAGFVTCVRDADGSPGVMFQIAYDGTVSATSFIGYGALLTSVDAATGDSATAFFDAGAIENTYGGTGQNSSGWTGFAQVSGGTWSAAAIAIGDLPTAAVSDGDTTHVSTADAIHDFCETTKNYLLTSENNDSADDVTIGDVQTACTNDFHNIGGTDDDVPEAVDYDTVFTANGLLTRTAASTYTSRAITGTSNEIAVTNGDGVSGNPTLALDSLVDLGGHTLEIPNSDAEPGSVTGRFHLDTAVSGLAGGGLKWYDADSVRINVDVEAADFGTGVTDDYVLAYDADNDKFYFKQDSTGGAGYAVYIEEGDAAKANSTVADLYVDFDGGDFNTALPGGNEVDVTINDGGIDHDSTTNFVANEHMDTSAWGANLVPDGDGTRDLGAVGGTDYRWQHLYLSGNISDETNTVTVANLKTAYDHSQDNTQAHSDYFLNTGADTAGAGSGFAWTFDASGGTDSVLTFGDGTVNVTTGALQENSQYVVTDATDCTDIEGTGLTITASILNADTASDTVVGVVELATAAETTTGTDATRAVTPDGLAGSIYGQKDFGWAVFEADTAVTVGDGVVGIPIPATLNGFDIVDVLAVVDDKGVTGTTDIQIRRRRAGAEVDVLSTKVTLGDEWFANDGVINTSNDDLATGDMLYPDVDAIHSGTAPNGLSIVITARKP